MSLFSQWVAAARLRTLPMAIAPVIVGSAVAATTQNFHLGRALLALIVALALQIGVNYANDYSDGIRGTDDDRVGPFRMTASGSVKPQAVKNAAFLFFGIAALAGLWLIILSSAWWLILVGIASVLAAWYYTGGSSPYGYMGLGEIFVFIFFGLVAVLGTTYTQAGELSGLAWAGAVGCGLISTALLMANNVRDIPTDREVGKNTLAVRLGDRAARISYVIMVLLAVAMPLMYVSEFPGMWLLLLTLLVAWKPIGVMLRTPIEDRAALIPVLKQTGMLGIIYAVLFAIGAVFPTGVIA